MSAPLFPPEGLRHSRLSREQCERLHAASLQILERTGVRLFEPEAIALARKAGAMVDDDRVRFPPRLIEWALSTAPKTLTLYNRRGEPAMLLEGARAFFGPGSDCLNLIDHRNNTRRKPTLRDVAEGITVCDALPNISFAMSLFLPAEVKQTIADRYQMEAMLNHTAKPIVFVTYDTAGCVDAIEMAEAVAGGAEALRARPFVACYINVTTALLHNTEALQKLLYLAEKNLPALYIPVVSAGSSGPMTLAGSVAVTNAGVLAGLALAQLKREGAPIIIPGFAGDALDMKTMVDPYAAPDPRGLAEALAQYYGLPMFTLAGASEAKHVDQQAGIEAALTLMIAALNGGHIVHDSGYLESGLTGSLAQLAICDEIIGWLRHYRREVDVNDETLALDLIDAQGPDGSFLASKHTKRHMRERWYPKLFERELFGAWQANGATTLAQRAAARVDEILATHTPAPLPLEVQQTLRAIVQRAEVQFSE